MFFCYFKLCYCIFSTIKLIMYKHKQRKPKTTHALRRREAAYTQAQKDPSSSVGAVGVILSQLLANLAVDLISGGHKGLLKVHWFIYFLKSSLLFLCVRLHSLFFFFQNIKMMFTSALNLVKGLREKKH